MTAVALVSTLTCPHCGHASAHLVGLHACHAVLATDAAAAHDDARGTRYESVIHAPLIDPPIA